MTPTLNIAALTRRTGVPPDTIRKWEQRYGVLHPERTSGGQRRYTEADVARVEWLKARLAEGYRIGEAAALLGPTAIVASEPDELRAAFVDAAARANVAELKATVERILQIEPVERAFADVLGPALVEIGDRWESGRLSVAEEHLASETVRAALQRLLADVRGSVHGVAVLACAPGERHEIGLMMLAVLLRAEGWQVAYLGPDVPVADVAGLAERLDASAVCFTASCESAHAELHEELARVPMPPSVRVLVGGRASPSLDVGEAARALAHA